MQISPQVPFPSTDGGKISIYNSFKNFSKLGAEVTLLCYTNVEIEKKNKIEINKYGNLKLFNHDLTNSKIRIIKSLFKTQSLYFSKYVDGNIFKYIDNIMSQNDYDVVHCDHSAIGQIGAYIKEKYNLPVGLRLQNIEYIIWRRYAEELKNGNLIDKLKYLYLLDQSNLIQYEETLLLKKLDAFFTISEVDTNRAKELNPSANIKNALGGVDTTNWKINLDRKKNFTIVLATNYNWIHNVNGLKWFLDEVFPIIVNTIPKVVFKIIGVNPPEWLSKYKDKFKNINVMGLVDNIYEEVSAASVCISPLFVGSGIRIKILESLSCGVPVVSTKVGAEGIIADEEKGLFVHDEPKEFAQSCIDMINFFDHNVQIGKEGRKLVKEQYSSFKSAEVMYNEYKRLLSLSD